MNNILYATCEEEKILIRIYEIHQITKTYYLKCEEYSEDMESILQPIKEFRDAYDHFIRFLCPNATSEYKTKNLDKALGHEYRAFFDTMDYFCLVMRERIYKLKEGLSIEDVEKRVPHYFKIKQKISKCCQEIAALRLEKDVMRIEKTVERYQEIAIELEKCHDEICGYLADE